jgi:hypothetical protein
MVAAGWSLGAPRDSTKEASYGTVPRRWHPYAPDNVYCATQQQNVSDIDRDRLQAAIRQAWGRAKAAGGGGWPKGIRGDARPKARVLTPMGRFGSVRVTAEACGIDSSSASRWLRNGHPRWHYAD